MVAPMLTPGCQSNANHSSGHLKPTLQQRHWACMVSFCHKSNPKEPSCHTLRCWNFKVETVIITTKDPNALLRINDAGVTIAHGGGIAGGDFVPCPGLAVGFAVAKEQPAHTKHATAWETKGTMFFASFGTTFLSWIHTCFGYLGKRPQTLRSWVSKGKGGRDLKGSVAAN